MECHSCKITSDQVPILQNYCLNCRKQWEGWQNITKGRLHYRLVSLWIGDSTSFPNQTFKNSRQIKLWNALKHVLIALFYHFKNGPEG